MPDMYPLELLANYTLMPTGVDNGVLAVCKRHDNEVKAMVVNSVGEAPPLGDLAFMAAEHETEEHGGPALPDSDETGDDRVGQALKLAVQYGQIDGANHKTWVIDQVVRILAGDRYDSVIADYRTGEGRA